MGVRQWFNQNAGVTIGVVGVEAGSGGAGGGTRLGASTGFVTVTATVVGSAVGRLRPLTTRLATRTNAPNAAAPATSKIVRVLHPDGAAAVRFRSTPVVP